MVRSKSRRLAASTVASTRRVRRHGHDGAVRFPGPRRRWDAIAPNGHKLTSGIYFLRLETGARQLTRKFVVMR